jgi:hypothetical protein
MVPGYLAYQQELHDSGFLAGPDQPGITGDRRGHPHRPEALMGKGWERRRRRLVSRLSQAGPVGGGLALLLSLGQAKNSDCEDAFAETALAVDGVVSAEFECSDIFGGGWQRGKVVLRASSRDEAVRIMDALLRAFAAEPRLEPRWATPQAYRN